MNDSIKNYMSGFKNECIYNIAGCDSNGLAAVNIMTVDGSSFIRLYWYNNDPSIAGVGFIDSLNVDVDSRCLGLGGRMLSIAEGLAKHIMMNEINLCVSNNEWMHAWYKRLGYTDTHIDYDIDTYMWMEKKI